MKQRRITWQEFIALAVIALTLYMCARNTVIIVWIFCISASIFYIPTIGIGKAEKLSKVNYPLFLFVAGCMAIGMAGGFSGGGKFIEYTTGMLLLFSVLVNFVLPNLPDKELYLCLRPRSQQMLSLTPI